MRHILVIILLIKITGCLAQGLNNNGLPYYKEAVIFISKSESAKAFAVSNFNSQEVRLYVSPEVIPFSAINILEDYVRKKYIKDFSIFKEISVDERETVNYVSDSLYSIDQAFNNDYQKLENKDLKALNVTSDENFIVFFSKVKNNFLYAELIPFNKTLYEDKRHNTVMYGQALTYLFHFNDDGTINEVFEGSVHKN